MMSIIVSRNGSMAKQNNNSSNLICGCLHNNSLCILPKIYNYKPAKKTHGPYGIFRIIYGAVVMIYEG